MNEREQKIHAVIGRLMMHEESRNTLIDVMAEAGYGVLKRVEHVTLPDDPERLANSRQAIILDCETTGLDSKVDGVTQLAMMKVAYDDEGIIAFGDFFDRLRDPGIQIPAEITELTGITPEMVAGKSISDQEVADFIGDADRIIAHNANFDRKMVEASFKGAGFDKSRWDCSVEQVDWKARMMPGRSLEMICLRLGYIYGAHQAQNDVKAAALALNSKSIDGVSAFSEMSRNGDLNRIHIFAAGADFHVKEKLRTRGYNWAPQDDPVAGHSKIWHRIFDASDEALADEAAFLRDEIYGRDKALPAMIYTPLEKYSERMPANREDFRTKEPKSAIEALRMMEIEPSSDQQSLNL